MNKKKICTLLAGAVSVCFVICLVDTLRAVKAALAAGAAVPTGMVMLTLVTLLCAVLIWKGVMEMK